MPWLAAGGRFKNLLISFPAGELLGFGRLFIRFLVSSQPVYVVSSQVKHDEPLVGLPL
jgi:hypothetical protein